MIVHRTYPLVFLLIILFWLFRYEDRLLHTIEEPEDKTNIPDLVVNNAPKDLRLFKYMFIGCQMQYEKTKALHPDFTLVADKGHKGDLTLNKTYSYDELGRKNEELLKFLCNTNVDDYDYYVKMDEDAFFDYNQLNRADAFDIAAIFNGENPSVFQGMVYIYSGRILKKACATRQYSLHAHKKHDDVQMADFLDVGGLVQKRSLRNTFIMHKYYRDKRLWLYFTPYVKCV